MRKNSNTLTWSKLCTLGAVLLLAAIFTSGFLLPGLIGNNNSVQGIVTPTILDTNTTSP